MSSSSPPSTSPAPYHRLKRAPITPPLPRPSWYPPNDERNSEANHRYALEEARLYHERVLRNALHVLHMNQAEADLAALEIEEARLAALEEVNAEAARKAQEMNDRTAAIEAQTAAIKAQTQAQQDARARAAYEQAQAQAQHAQQAQQVRAQQAQQHAQQQAPPPPIAVQPLPAPIAASQPLASTTIQPPPTSQSFFTQQPTPQAAPSTTTQQTFSQPTQTPSTATLPFGAQPTFQPPTTHSHFALQPTQTAPQPHAQQTEQAPQPDLQPKDIPTIDYIEKEDNSAVNKDNARLNKIHINLKGLRKAFQEELNGNPRLKTRAGELRRLIRMSVGQLTGDPASNKFQINALFVAFEEALANKTVPSKLREVQWFVVDADREEKEGAVNNEKTLPGLFLFLLNHFSKAVINQLAEEAGIKPHMADAIGIIAVRIFSRTEFLWRGKSLIDILIAKYRMVCPVLFGVRAREDVDNGRIRLGWKRVNGRFIREEVHANRMTGFGAGYAAICLRDFSRTQLSHPYAVAYYWMAFASIVSTPAGKVTKTQCFVLKALIDNYELKFLRFYGAAALGALQVATIHFPGRIAEQNDATLGLSGLPAKLKLHLGIDLVQDAFRG